MTISVVKVDEKGLDRVTAFLDKSKRKAFDLSVPLRKGGLDMLLSIDRNFRSGGRPAWKPLSPAYLRWKLRNRYSPLPLIRTGALKQSITYRVTRNKLSIGTSIPYAGYHQFGTRTIPKRKFLLFQKEDIEGLNNLIAKHMVGEK